MIWCDYKFYACVEKKGDGFQCRKRKRDALHAASVPNNWNTTGVLSGGGCKTTGGTKRYTSYEAEEKSHNNVRCTIIVGIHRTTRLIWLAELWQNVGSSNLSAAIFSPWSSFDTLSAKPANMVRNLLVRKDSQFDCRFPRLQKLNFLQHWRWSSVITSKLTFISIFYYTAFRPYTMLHREEEEFDGFGPGTST